MALPDPLPKPTRPVVVAAARGVIEAIVLAVIAGAVMFLGSVDLGTLAPYAPAAFLALRVIEGKVDETIDPTRQRGTLGGTPAPEEHPPAG
jgi:hypothetical protein